MDRHELKAAFHSGRRVYGTLIASPSPKWAAELPKAGLDFVFIDAEHMPMDPQARGWMLRCYRALGLAPIVRIPSCTYQEAFQAVEHGAEGVIAPYIETVEEVKTLLAAVKYRPLKGERLRGVLDGTITLSQKERDYFRRYNDGNLLLLNIESRAAADNLESLLLPEVDAVIIGPHDLSINLGHPEEYAHPEFLRYVKHIIETCRARGVGVGNHSSWDLDQQIQWARWGMNIIQWNSDVGRFVQGISADFACVRAELGDDAQGGGTVTI
jgi:4-hydroxy-2-oxoheptanedioate aldolase